ncbi:MAG: hypothetical protein N3A38_17355, partial [Planctomycetota bacterium]|nr:hypothetical protein [Planctomycetota bacterium]
MADWKDFYEDNREFLGQYLDSLAEKRGTGKTESAPSPPRLELCPLCHAVFTESRAMEQHVYSVHGPQHVYLRVNGRIIRDIGWAEQGISELRIVLLGYPQAEVELAGGGFCKVLTAGDRSDLRQYVPADFEGELIVHVKPPEGKRREFILYTRSLPEFRGDRLDALILRLSAEDTAPGGSPDVSRWRKEAGKLGNLENRYLNGFFEYVLAFHLGNMGMPERAKLHFEEAFGLLLPFRTPMAHSAQCV